MPDTKQSRPYRAPDREVTLATIEKNPTTQIRVTLARFDPLPTATIRTEPVDTLQIREWFMWEGRSTLTAEQMIEGVEPKYLREWRPTQKGITLNMELASELMYAIVAAIEKEVEWIDE